MKVVDELRSFVKSNSSIYVDKYLLYSWYKRRNATHSVEYKYLYYVNGEWYCGPGGLWSSYCV